MVAKEALDVYKTNQEIKLANSKARTAAINNATTSGGRFWAGLPGWGKGLVIASGIVVVVVGYKVVTTQIKKYEEKSALNTNKSELGQLASQGIHQSYPDSQFQSWANTIVKNIDGCNFDEVPVILIIKSMKKDIDWLKLVEAFGTKTIKGCMMASDRTVALQDALNWKLSNTTIMSLNALFQAKGMKYRL